MVETTEQAGGVFETRADAGKGGEGAYRLWRTALDLAEKEEKNWRDSARQAVLQYRAEENAEIKGNRAEFNILYSSVQTQAPAIYNSTPRPDVRLRVNDEDPVGKIVSQVYERVLSHCLDEYDFDSDIEAVVHDSLLPGRGVAMVEYDAVVRPNEEGEDEKQYETVQTKFVQWDDFRHGPGRRWVDVPWVAVRHRLTRDQAVKMNPKAGATVKLDYIEKGTDKENADVPDVFKRLTVWQIWDKPKRQIIYFAPSYKEGLFKVEPDLLRLKQFFPFPRPLYDVHDSGSLVPLVPYEMYKKQAQELDDVTRRIRRLVKVLRWRGIRPANVEEFDRLKDAEDGDLVASESASTLLATISGDLSKAVWIMPIERLIEVIRELVVHRETIKGVIFEITGLSDILRGETNPNETLGAQQIKAQWGSLRMQRRQREVQRFARDILRLKAEIIGEHFSAQTLSMISGIRLPTPEEKAIAQQQGMPQAAEVLALPTWDDVKQVMSDDALRSYRVDIETDSTIQADLGAAQENMARFVEGFSAFTNAVGPAVQAGVMPMDVVTDLLTGFARNFKLGRQAEDALERLSKQAPEQRPNPRAEVEQQRMQAEQAAKQEEMQLRQAENEQKMQLEQAKRAEDMQFQRETRDMERQDRHMEMEMRRRENAEKMAFEKRKFDGTEAGRAATDLDDLRNSVTATAQALQDTAATVQAVMAEVASLSDSLSQPKTIDVQRKNGKVVGGVVTQGGITTEVTLQ